MRKNTYWVIADSKIKDIVIEVLHCTWKYCAVTYHERGVHNGSTSNIQRADESTRCSYGCNRDYTLRKRAFKGMKRIKELSWE